MVGGWIEEFDTDLTVVMSERRLPARSDYFAELQTSKLEHAENLRSTADVTGITDFTRLLAALVKPSLCEVGYIDIWGTWCDSCRENMKTMPPIKKELDDEYVVFLYLASRSPED